MANGALMRITIMDPEIKRIDLNLTPLWRIEGRETAVKILDVDAAEYIEALPTVYKTPPAFLEAEVNIVGDDLKSKERVILKVPRTVALSFRDHVRKAGGGSP